MTQPDDAYPASWTPPWITTPEVTAIDGHPIGSLHSGTGTTNAEWTNETQNDYPREWTPS